MARHTRTVAIPATIPLILSILEDVGRGRMISQVYLALLCQRSSSGVVTVTDEKEMAFFAGLGGQRGERTWRSRLDVLAALGFVNIKEGPNGEVRRVVIYEPVKVIKRLAAEGTVGLNVARYQALMAA